MRKRTPSPIHAHRKATFTVLQVSPVRYYMEEEMSLEELSEKLIDCSLEQFHELFKLYNKNFFKYGCFNGVYFYTISLSSMFLFFNDEFYLKYQSDCYYGLQSSLEGLSSLLLKESYPNETEYLKTAAYLNGWATIREGSYLIGFNY